MRILNLKSLQVIKYLGKLKNKEASDIGAATLIDLDLERREKISMAPAQG